MTLLSDVVWARFFSSVLTLTSFLLQDNRNHHGGDRYRQHHQSFYPTEKPRTKSTHQATVEPPNEKKIGKTTTIVGKNDVEGEKEKVTKRDERNRVFEKYKEEHDRHIEKCRAERERKNQENNAWVAKYLRKKKEEAASLAEKKTARIMGRSAVDEKQIKGAIRDRLIEKYKAEQEIKKQEYDANPPDNGSSNEESDDEDMYDGMHPIDYDTKQNLTYLRALAELEIPPVEGKCWCFLSKGNRQWHWKNKVTNHIWGTCHINCRPFDSRQSLVNHLREGDAMHKYTLEFLEEWWKQE
jgi:hypothetical protein